MINNQQDDSDSYALSKFPVIYLIDDDAILTPQNISNLIGVHEETVRRWCRNGYLKCLSPFGRYKIRGADFKSFALQWYVAKKEKHRKVF
ncbi:helix-turn-helix domain-containing protein [Peribacillus sp. NPDC097675]|uniref:helix-turn-helix domain-containing protein n=1 Tax=Peribacillus sp. NPDC097675 TaxID=3390618 RepID=UPI003D005626